MKHSQVQEVLGDSDDVFNQVQTCVGRGQIDSTLEIRNLGKAVAG